MSLAVFVDVDGIVAHFVKAALKHHNREDVRIADVPWGLEEMLGLSPADFWRDLGREYWAGLPVLEDGMALLKKAEKLVGQETISLLTKPCDTDGCDAGKRDWVKKHLPRYHRQTLIGASKHHIAGPDKVLVDDSDKNCGAFRAAGGVVLLVPRPWNARKAETNSEGEFDVESVGYELAEAINNARG